MDIKTKKISELPEASSIDGLFSLGTDGEGKSVKVPIELLKGNKGNTGAAGKDGATPVIGDNGNWWINGVDTGQPAQGEDGGNLASKTIYNISQTNDKYDYADSTAARNAIPGDMRGLGQIVSYKLASGKWITESYQGADIAGWATDSNWQGVGGGSVEPIESFQNVESLSDWQLYKTVVADTTDNLGGEYIIGAKVLRTNNTVISLSGTNIATWLNVPTKISDTQRITKVEFDFVRFAGSQTSVGNCNFLGVKPDGTITVFAGPLNTPATNMPEKLIIDLTEYKTFSFSQSLASDIHLATFSVKLYTQTVTSGAQDVKAYVDGSVKPIEGFLNNAAYGADSVYKHVDANTQDNLNGGYSGDGYLLRANNELQAVASAKAMTWLNVPTKLSDTQRITKAVFQFRRIAGNAGASYPNCNFLGIKPDGTIVPIIVAIRNTASTADESTTIDLTEYKYFSVSHTFASEDLKASFSLTLYASSVSETQDVKSYIDENFMPLNIGLPVEINVTNRGNVVFSAYNYILKKENGFLMLSRDLGVSWQSLPNTYGPMKMAHVFTSGEAIWANDKEVFYTKDFITVNKSTVFDIDGSVFVPSNYDNFTRSTLINTTPHVINGNEILVWGNYSIATDNSGYTPCAWYTTDKGATIKCCFKFRSTIPSNLSGSLQCRHVHGIGFNEADKSFWLFTGDDEPTTLNSHLIKGYYDDTADTWNWIHIGSGDKYKLQDIFFIDYWAYMVSDHKIYAGLQRCFIENIANPDLFQSIFNVPDKPLIGCIMDRNRNIVMFPDAEDRGYIYVSVNGVNFARLKVGNISSTEILTGIHYPNYNGDAYICLRDTANPHWLWDRPTYSVNLTEMVRKAGVSNFMK